MTEDQYDTKCEEFEVKLVEYNRILSEIGIFTGCKSFYTAIAEVTKAENLFSDGLLEELHSLAKERDNLDPPESEMDIIKDSDGYKVGE